MKKVDKTITNLRFIDSFLLMTRSIDKLDSLFTRQPGRTMKLSLQYLKKSPSYLMNSDKNSKNKGIQQKVMKKNIYLKRVTQFSKKQEQSVQRIKLPILSILVGFNASFFLNSIHHRVHWYLHYNSK